MGNLINYFGYISFRKTLWLMSIWNIKFIVFIEPNHTVKTSSI